jgi:hypothetical protein
VVWKTLDRLVEKYGWVQVRAACNHYVKTNQERARAKKEIAALENQLQELKAKAY